VPAGPTRTLASILRVTCVINIFMLVAEVFTEFYTGGSHVAPARYLFFGSHGKSALVPWIWSAIALNVTAAALLLSNASRRSPRVLEFACVLTFIGVWIGQKVRHAASPETFRKIFLYGMLALGLHMTRGLL